MVKKLAIEIMFAKIITTKLLMMAVHKDNDKLWTQQLTKASLSVSCDAKSDMLFV